MPQQIRLPFTTPLRVSATKLHQLRAWRSGEPLAGVHLAWWEVVLAEQVHLPQNYPSVWPKDLPAHPHFPAIAGG